MAADMRPFSVLVFILGATQTLPRIYVVAARPASRRSCDVKSPAQLAGWRRRQPASFFGWRLYICSGICSIACTTVKLDLLE